MRLQSQRCPRAVKPHARHRWQSGNKLPPLPLWSGLFSRPPRPHRMWPHAGPAAGLPSLDVHLVGRGAILHLTLAGGACGQEKHKGAEVNGQRTPGPAPPPPPGPQETVSRLALSLAEPGPTPPSHQCPAPFLWLLPWSHFPGSKLTLARADPPSLPLKRHLRLPLCSQSPNLELQSLHFSQSCYNLELPTQWVHFIPPCEQGSSLPAGRVGMGISACAPSRDVTPSCLHPGAWRCGEGR